MSHSNNTNSLYGAFDEHVSELYSPMPPPRAAPFGGWGDELYGDYQLDETLASQLLPVGENWEDEFLNPRAFDDDIIADIDQQFLNPQAFDDDVIADIDQQLSAAMSAATNEVQPAAREEVQCVQLFFPNTSDINEIQYLVPSTSQVVAIPENEIPLVAIPPIVTPPTAPQKPSNKRPLSPTTFSLTSSTLAPEESVKKPRTKKKPVQWSKLNNPETFPLHLIEDENGNPIPGLRLTKLVAYWYEKRVSADILHPSNGGVSVIQIVDLKIIDDLDLKKSKRELGNLGFQPNDKLTLYPGSDSKTFILGSSRHTYSHWLDYRVAKPAADPGMSPMQEEWEQIAKELRRTPESVCMDILTHHYNATNA